VQRVIGPAVREAVSRMRIRVAHSPDVDDAFMFYGLASGNVDSGRFQLEHVLEDIQTLNEKARQGVYEVTAISIAAYPQVAGQYVLADCGGSVGDGYGPVLVSGRQIGLKDLVGGVIAVPGTLTTAFMVLQLLLGKENFRPRVVRFDRIAEEVLAGRADAGLLIHEGQLTYAAQGLYCVADLGKWWKGQTGLPLPLGGNAIRRDLGAAVCRELCELMRRSILYGLSNRSAALQYALRFGRGLDAQQADRFVGWYVNDCTVDYGAVGRAAIQRLLDAAAAAGLTPRLARLDFA
jgi:1,4-dihydroxy-6-naphthoate synthase